jgi:hypothetical protein
MQKVYVFCKSRGSFRQAATQCNGPIAFVSPELDGQALESLKSASGQRRLARRAQVG